MTVTPSMLLRCAPRGRLRAALGLALGAALYLLAAAVSAAPGVPAPERVVAVGDVHGDHDALVRLLARAGLLDMGRRWVGGRTVLVQTGDYLDRGAQVREVLDLLMGLQSQAAAAGGQVVVLLGNHEAMNLVGELRDVAPEALAAFADEASTQRREDALKAYQRVMGRQVSVSRPALSPPTVLSRKDWLGAHPLGDVEYREALGPDGRYGKWLRERPAAAQIGDTLFVHGGIDPGFVKQSVEEVNGQVRDELQRVDRVRRVLVDRGRALPFSTLQELFDAARRELMIAEAVADGRADEYTGPSLGPGDLQLVQDFLRIGSWYLLNPNGPLWFRGYATWSSEEGATRMAAVLERHGVARVVVGHTMMTSLRVTPRFGGRVFLIDTGMLASYYKGGRASALDIQGADVRVIYEEANAEGSSPAAAPKPS